MAHGFVLEKALIRSSVVAGLAIVIAGCGRHKSAPAQAATQSQAASSPSEVADLPMKPDPHWQQSFADATVADPPADQRPPDLTMTGKSVGKLYTEVVRLWDSIHFFSVTGKPLHLRAILDTEEGQIEIMLRPDLAPNHVRSFIALSQCGYFDGLVFERTVHEQIEGQDDAKIELIEAGCPLGTGDADLGSIGYWLKPEFNPKATHEVGAIGACHGEQPDTAACKFYINLNPAPFMDGQYTIFGKVTRGLDVARKILSLPVRYDTEYPEGDRPEKPVVIRKVTILTEGDGELARAD